MLVAIVSTRCETVRHWRRGTLEDPQVKRKAQGEIGRGENEIDRSPVHVLDQEMRDRPEDGRGKSAKQGHLCDGAPRRLAAGDLGDGREGGVIEDENRGYFDDDQGEREGNEVL